MCQSCTFECRSSRCTTDVRKKWLNRLTERETAISILPKLRQACKWRRKWKPGEKRVKEREKKEKAKWPLSTWFSSLQVQDVCFRLKRQIANREWRVRSNVTLPSVLTSSYSSFESPVWSIQLSPLTVAAVIVYFFFFFFCVCVPAVWLVRMQFVLSDVFTAASPFVCRVFLSIKVTFADASAVTWSTWML